MQDAFRRIWSLKYTLLLLVVFQTFDTLSTVLALGHGVGEEANPLLRLFFEGDSVTSVVMLKWLVVATAFAGVAADPRDTKTDFVKIALVIMNVVYAVVLSLNFVAYGLGSGDWILPAAFWGLVLALAIVAVDEAFFSGRMAERMRSTPTATDDDSR